MPKVKKSINLFGGNFIIPFGRKHRGKTLSQLHGRSFRYIVWLSGHVVDNSGVKTLEQSTSERIGTKQDPRTGKRECLHCEYPEELLTFKQKQCELVGNTAEETLELIRQNPDSEYLKIEHGYYATWLKISKEYPDAVEAARFYIDKNELCFRCGKQLILPADSGEEQVDKKIRRRKGLHNQC